MSTALAVVSKDSFLALANQDEDLKAAMAAMDEVGERIGPDDLIKVKVPGEARTKWTVTTIAGEETVEDLRGVLVYVQRRGVLWPSEEPSEGAKPVLVTDDLLVARQMSPIPDNMLESCEVARIDREKNPEIYIRFGIPAGSYESLYDWTKLPYNQFGSGKNGSGKRCKEQRILYILREGDLYPIRVVSPPGSIKNVSTFLKLMPAAAKVPYWHCIVSLKLESTTNQAGQKYSRIVPTLVGKLSSEDAAVIKKTFTDALANIANEIADLDD